MMIGIILWLILIFIIAVCSCPGFITFLVCVGIPVAVGAYFLGVWLDKIISKWR